jgi:hypothetical protein
MFVSPWQQSQLRDKKASRPMERINPAVRKGKGTNYPRQDCREQTKGKQGAIDIDKRHSLTVLQAQRHACAMWSKGIVGASSLDRMVKRQHTLIVWIRINPRIFSAIRIRQRRPGDLGFPYHPWGDQTAGQSGDILSKRRCRSDLYGKAVCSLRKRDQSQE